MLVNPTASDSTQSSIEHSNDTRERAIGSELSSGSTHAFGENVRAQSGNQTNALARESEATPVDNLAHLAGQFAASNSNGGNIVGASRAALENHGGFRPQKQTNHARLDAEIAIFGDFHLDPRSSKNASIPVISNLSIPVDINIAEWGEQPDPRNNPMPFGLPNTHFLTVPGPISFGIYKTADELSVAGIAQPNGAFVTFATPLATKSFIYGDTNGNVGAAIGWMGQVSAGPVGATAFARLHVSGSIAGFLHGLDSTPSDLSALAPGGVVEQTYSELQQYEDQHGTLAALGIRNLNDYKAAIEHYATTGGLSDLPVEVSALAWNERNRSLSADDLNRQLATHLAHRIDIVNDADGSQTAADMHADLTRVKQQITTIEEKLANTPVSYDEFAFAVARPEFSNGSVASVAPHEVTAYKDRLDQLHLARQSLEDHIAGLPKKFGQDLYDPNKINSILENHLRLQEQAFAQIENRLTLMREELNIAQVELLAEVNTANLPALQEKVDALAISVRNLESEKSLISSGHDWQPDISGEAYAVTEALQAKLDLRANNESIIGAVENLPPGAPKPDRDTLAEIKSELPVLEKDISELQNWLQDNARIPSARSSADDINSNMPKSLIAPR